MTAAKVALSLEQGATKRFELLWGSGSSEADVVPYDLAGCKARMMIKQAFNTASVLDATTEDGGITLQPDDRKGVIAVYLSDEKTDTIELTQALWDLEVEWPNGDVSRVAQGTVLIAPSVTRP
jgi:hypothetical protein